MAPMIENIPLIAVPVPDYQVYREAICQQHHVTFPLKKVPFFADGLLRHLPAPLQKDRHGWPWTLQSEVIFNAGNACPKISVVVPSFQQGEFIEEAIRSVLLQNYPNIELIIMDGGSRDGTQCVLDHYQAFISLAIVESDRGQSHALNKGFSMAGGDLFFWLNSDDYLNISSFNKMVPLFNKDQRLDIIYGDGLLLNNSTGELKPDQAPLVLERYLRFGGIVLSHAVIWRSRVHCKLWEDLQCAMDAELWLRLFNGRRNKHCHYPIGVFRTHPQQKTSDQLTWSRKWEADFKMHIWKHYPAISSKKWARREREYRWVQKIYGMLRKLSKQI
jgi:glycosyltransferase involved in cell wall biosynthesis